MNILITDMLSNILMIAGMLSIILMAIIQKLKTLGIIKKGYQIFLSNLFISFLFGIPFATTFYDMEINKAIWVCIFAFIGAPGIYEVMKKQNIINYTPKSLDDYIEVKKENLITRDD